MTLRPFLPIVGSFPGLELNRATVSDLPSVFEDSSPGDRVPQPKMSERIPDEIVELVLNAELEKDDWSFCRS